jgi:hypothetical protein
MNPRAARRFVAYYRVSTDRQCLNGPQELRRRVLDAIER